ncbi:hypothetical protein M8J77_003684 [Diaphorina citri]|nr:hypothetical protein M8J77_003684 [Diaphorina citri]
MPRKFQTVVSIVESMPPEDVDYNFVKKKLRSEEGKLSARDNSGSSGVRKEIKSELSAASSVALTTDCWSSRSQQSYITVTAHFIDSTWHTKTVTLSTHEISHRHTADKLATEVQKTEEKWDLITKTTAVVTDNAANVIKSNHQHGLNDPCSYSTGTQDQGQQDAQEQRAKAPRPFPHIFDTTTLKQTSGIHHHIPVISQQPVHTPPYKLSPTKRAFVDKQVRDMLFQGLIEPSDFPYCSPIVVIEDNDPAKEPRFCIDYRKLNSITVEQNCPAINT